MLSFSPCAAWWDSDGGILGMSSWYNLGNVWTEEQVAAILQICETGLILKSPKSIHSPSDGNANRTGGNPILETINPNKGLSKPHRDGRIKKAGLLFQGHPEWQKSVFLKKAVDDEEPHTAQTSRQWKKFSFWWTGVEKKGMAKQIPDLEEGRGHHGQERSPRSQHHLCPYMQDNKKHDSLQDKAASSGIGLAEALATRKATLWIREERGMSQQCQNLDEHPRCPEDKLVVQWP